CGLAGAGRAHDAEEFALLDGEVHPAQRGDRARVLLGDAGEGDDRTGTGRRVRGGVGAHIFGTPTFTPSRRPPPDTSTRPSANMPSSTFTSRTVPPRTTWRPKPPPGRASSAFTGTVRTSS